MSDTYLGFNTGCLFFIVILLCWKRILGYKNKLTCCPNACVTETKEPENAEAPSAVDDAQTKDEDTKTDIAKQADDSTEMVVMYE